MWKYKDNYYESQKTNCKKILQCDKSDGKVIKEWSSVKEAAIKFGVTVQSIRRACNGMYETCCGYLWRNSEN